MHLIINNPPKNDEEFERFIHDLEEGYDFKYLDQSFKLPRMKVTRTEARDYAHLAQAVNTYHNQTSAEVLSSTFIHQVVNPGTFDRCIETNSIRNNKLITSPGWLASYISRTLSEEQWCYLLGNAARKSLNLYLAPGVDFPSNFSQFVAHTQDLSSKGQAFFRTPQPSMTNNTTVIDVSECSPDDLLYRFSYRFDSQSGCFVFEETISDVWLRLERGETIILTGNISQEIQDHLTSLLLPNPYLWHDGKKKTFKGKLVLNQEMAKTLHGKQVTPRKVNDVEQRKSQTLALLEENPAIFIAGEPGIGKSCFIRELKADSRFDCISFNPNDKSTLISWASSKPSRPFMLMIDEATIRGTDWTLFRGLYTPRSEILIEGKIHQLTPMHKVIFIGNPVKNMPALLGSKMPTLIFDTLTREYVIQHILQPIFAQKKLETSLAAATEHYNADMTVRALQASAIALCSSDTALNHSESAPQERPDSFLITPSRQPIFESLMASLKARRFMQEANADPARYGGKTGQMLTGLPGQGKTEIIHDTMTKAGFTQITDLKEMYDEKIDHRFRYYRIPASCNIGTLRRHLEQAFQQGCIVHVDEFDSMLGNHAILIAELNAYLMGEDLQHRRPKQPGFMLLATGNGIAYRGRAAVPESLASRLHTHSVEPYSEVECHQIIRSAFGDVQADHLIQKFINNPKSYTFRQLLSECKMIQESRTPQTQRPVFTAYQPQVTRNPSIAQRIYTYCSLL